MRAWRICDGRHARAAFNGKGARENGGRWNSKGTSLVYASEHLSLAALEYFVNIDPEEVPDGLVAVAAEVPEDLLEVLDLAKLPRHWREVPAPQPLQQLGDGWARGGGVALAVPSAIIPDERNILLNPEPAAFQRIRPLPARPFSFDPRMWK